MPYPPLPTPRAVVLLLLLSGCAAAPEGPQNTVQVPPERLASAGARASLQIQRRGELLRELDTTRYVRCVADALIQAIPAAPADWEVVVMRDETPDAWALAGRRLGVTKALLRVTGNQDRLAAVLAHGIAHELLGHTGAHITPSVAASLEGDAARAAPDPGDGDRGLEDVANRQRQLVAYPAGDGELELVLDRQQRHKDACLRKLEFPITA